jgi:hypothetical protein
MAIEVRELQIRSRVDNSARASSARGIGEEPNPVGERQLERLRESVLAECRALVAAAMRERQER